MRESERSRDTERDLIVYALGVGASELKFVHENDEQFAALPTFPFVLPFKGTEHDVVGFPSEAMMEGSVVPPVPGTKFLLDGERFLEVLVGCSHRCQPFLLLTRGSAASDSRRDDSLSSAQQAARRAQEGQRCAGRDRVDV